MLWVEGLAARANALPMLLQRCAGVRLASAPRTSASRPLLVSCWTPALRAHSERMLMISAARTRPVACSRLRHGLTGAQLGKEAETNVSNGGAGYCSGMRSSTGPCQDSLVGACPVSHCPTRARFGSDHCAFVTLRGARRRMHCTALLCDSWDLHFRVQRTILA
jgi:hypothetical protein